MATPRGWHLLELPRHILLEIGSHLCWWYGDGTGAAFKPSYVHVANLATVRTEAAACQAGLDALGRTCKLLQGVAHLLLYRAPCLTRADGLGLLVTTLAVRPDLAETVVELHDLRVDVDDAALIIETNCMWEEFDEPGITSLAIVALACMPRLVRAHLRLQGSAHFVPDGLLRPYPGNDEMDDVMPPNVVMRLCPDDGQTGEAVRNNPSVQVLALSSPASEFNLHMDALCQKGYLANLEHLHIHGCARFFGDSAATSPPAPPLLQNLASLTLTRMAMSTIDVQRLLASVANKDPDGQGSRLTAVHMDYVRPSRHANVTNGSDIWDLQLGKVLDLCYPWRNRLTALSFFREDQACQPIGGSNLRKLRAYTALGSLATEARLLGMCHSDDRDGLARILPASLQNLRLFGSGYSALPLAGLLEAHQRGLFPRLQMVRLDAFPPDSLYDIKFDHLAQAYRSDGVHLSFIEVD